MPAGRTPCKLIGTVFTGPKVFIAAVPSKVITAPSGAIVGAASVVCLYQQTYRDSFNCCGATTYVAGIQYTTESLGPSAVLPVAVVSLPLPLAGALGSAAMVLGAGVNIAVWWANPATAATANALCAPGTVVSSGKTGGTPTSNCAKNLIFYPWGGTQTILPGTPPTPGVFLSSRSRGPAVGGLLAFRSGYDELSKFPALIQSYNAQRIDVPDWFPQGTIHLDIAFDDGVVLPVWLTMSGGRIVRFKTTPYGDARTHIFADEETVTRFLTSEFPIDYFVKSIIAGRLTMSLIRSRPAVDAAPTVFDQLDPRDDLARVEGIDATLKTRLGAAGIFRLSDLRDADTGALEVDGIAQDRLTRFQQAAAILFEFPTLTGDDVEVLMDGLGEKSAERLRSGAVSFEADAVRRAVGNVRVPRDYDTGRLMAMFGTSPVPPPSTGP